MEEPAPGDKTPKPKKVTGKRDKPEPGQIEEKTPSQVTPTKSELAAIGYFAQS